MLSGGTAKGRCSEVGQRMTPPHRLRVFSHQKLKQLPEPSPPLSRGQKLLSNPSRRNVETLPASTPFHRECDRIYVREQQLSKTSSPLCQSVKPLNHSIFQVYEAHFLLTGKPVLTKFSVPQLGRIYLAFQSINLNFHRFN